MAEDHKALVAAAYRLAAEREVVHLHDWKLITDTLWGLADLIERLDGGEGKQDVGRLYGECGDGFMAAPSTPAPSGKEG